MFCIKDDSITEKIIFFPLSPNALWMNDNDDLLSRDDGKSIPCSINPNAMTKINVIARIWGL
jgi:hypothetical protein